MVAQSVRLFDDFEQRAAATLGKTGIAALERALQGQGHVNGRAPAGAAQLDLADLAVGGEENIPGFWRQNREEGRKVGRPFARMEVDPVDDAAKIARRVDQQIAAVQVGVNQAMPRGRNLGGRPGLEKAQERCRIFSGRTPLTRNCSRLAKVLGSRAGTSKRS